MKFLLILFFLVPLLYGQDDDGERYIRYKDFNDQTISELGTQIEDSVNHGYVAFAFYDSSVVIAVAGSDTNWVTNADSTLWTGAGSSGFATFAGDSAVIITGGAGYWKIDINLSFAGVNNEVWQIGFSVNGTLQGSGQRNTANNNIGNASWFQVLNLAVGDVIKPVISNTIDADNMTVKSGSMFMFKLN